MYDISDYSELEIYITNGWQDWYVPKFRLYMIVDEPICYLYWTDTEKGASGIERQLPLDFNDVTFGYTTPSSASEVALQIGLYQVSAWTNIPTGGVQSVDDDGLGIVEVDNADPVNPIIRPVRIVYPIDATTDAITHTATLAETLLYNYPIPAGELLSNSILEIMYMGRKTTGAASTHTLRLYLNNVATIGGAGSVLLINNAQSLTTFLGEDRVKWLNSDTSIACKPATNAAWGGATSAVPILSSMDRTAIVYVQLTMQLTVAADVFTLYWVEVNHFKNSI